MPQPKIEVYGKPKCGQCDMTTGLLDKATVTYEKFDVTTDKTALAKVSGMGYQGAPVVIWTNRHGIVEHWYGFRPDKLKHLAADWKAWQE